MTGLWADEELFIRKPITMTNLEFIMAGLLIFLVLGRIMAPPPQVMIVQPAPHPVQPTDYFSNVLTFIVLALVMYQCS
jgi:hypothetical protein